MISVVLPVLNEEDNLPRIPTELIPVLRDAGEPWEVVVVNDGSSDRSPAILEKLSKDFGVRVFHHPRPLGMGAALQTGFKECRGDKVITLDADFTFHPSVIPKLLAKAKEAGADCVIGSPFLEGAELKSVPLHRAFLTHVSNWIYRHILKFPTTSITAICRLYRRDQLVKIPMSVSGFSINAEILSELVRMGAKIVETPAALTTRVGGVSKANLFRESVRHLQLMFRLLKKRYLA